MMMIRSIDHHLPIYVLNLRRLRLSAQIEKADTKNLKFVVKY